MSLRPSSQRKYKSSEIGDLRTGEPVSGCAGLWSGDEVEGSPDISSSSVTTSPFAVISLRRMMRLCGNSERAVWMWLRTAELLETERSASSTRVNTAHEDALVDPREDVKYDVVSEFRVDVPQLFETARHHT